LDTKGEFIFSWKKRSAFKNTYQAIFMLTASSSELFEKKLSRPKKEMLRPLNSDDE